MYAQGATSRVVALLGLLPVWIAPSLAQTDPSLVQPIRTPTHDLAFDALHAAALGTGSVPLLVALAEPNLPAKSSARARVLAITQAQDHLLATLPPAGAKLRRRYSQLPVLALEADAATIERLRTSPYVAGVQEDALYAPLLDQSVPLIGADQAWAIGGSGAGQIVAVVDTGVDTEHPFLAGKVTAEACFSTSYASTTTDFRSVSLCPDGEDEQAGAGTAGACDASIAGCDHGTRVAGIAAGRGELFSGVARDAEVLAIQVFSRFENYCGDTPCVRSWVSDQIAALEYVYAVSDTMPIAAVNLSLGGGHYTSEESCDQLNPAMKSAIDLLWSKGIAVVAASGNSGMSDGLVAPACVSTSVSVGATSLADAVSYFSSSAIFLDLLAPGEHITSSVPGGGFASGDGTSFAAPHVAGAWAILRARSPEASIDQILADLHATGLPVLDSRNEVTTTRIRVDLALEANILPVELTRFDGMLDGEQASFVWETASETNNAGFEIQHATADAFETIGFVAGGGTRSGVLKYAYEVPHLAPGRHRFRLKQIDFDGYIAYSPEVTLYRDLDSTYHLGAAYPNPFNPQTRFSLTVSSPQYVRIQVFNLLGQQVALLEEAMLEADRPYSYTFDAGHLPNGLYLIQARGETFETSRTAMLLK